MKKILLLVLTILGVTGFSTAQSFDQILAGILQHKIDSIRSANNLKGISACVIYPGVGTWKGVSGISHAGFPISSEMEFGIGSNTKLFTGVLLLKLAENKLLHLDDSLYQYLPNFNHVNLNITIRQLLNHTSGLADVNTIPGYSDSILTDPDRIFSPDEVINWIGAPLFPPGTGWDYCNTNYLLAGMVAESATGQSYGQLLRDSILAPLQLDSTFLDVYDSVSITVAHPWQGGVDRFSTPRKALNSVAWSAGAMYSTSGEMAQWYQALMHGQVLSSNAFNDLTTFVGSGNYGIGLFSTSVLGRTVWQHGGTIWGGYNSSMVYDTTTGIVICVLINQLPAQAFQVSTKLLSALIDHPVLNSKEDTVDSEHFIVYPNPTSGLVNIDLSSQDIQSIQVFNATGQMLKETLETQFSMSDFPNGVYLITAKTAEGTIRYKLIKQ